MPHATYNEDVDLPHIASLKAACNIIVERHRSGMLHVGLVESQHRVRIWVSTTKSITWRADISYLYKSVLLSSYCIDANIISPIQLKMESFTMEFDY